MTSALVGVGWAGPLGAAPIPTLTQSRVSRTSTTGSGITTTPLFDGSTDGSTMADSVLTADGADGYRSVRAAGSITVSALPGNQGRNLREVYWPGDAPSTTDEMSCADWSDSDVYGDQEGIALRIAPSPQGGTRAITVTKNVYDGGFSDFNVHVWNSALAQPYTLLGQFDLASVVGTFSHPVRYPWHVCARVVGNRFQFMVWTGITVQPSWPDAGRVEQLTLPPGWDYPGAAGWYVGHLRPSDAATMATPRTWALAGALQGLPGAPSAVAATGANGRATVRWSPSLASGGAPITGYLVTPYDRSVAATTGSVVESSRLVPALGASTIVTGLSNGSAYSFTVAAVNAYGVGAQSAPSALTVPPFPSATALIDRQFADFLGRRPTPGELAGWLGSMTGGTNPGAFIAALRRSADATTNVDPVARLYFAYFRRMPDAGGLGHWTAVKRGGRSLYAISNLFARSSEFARTYGSLGDTGFVDLVYRNVLGRIADPDGSRYWVSLLAHGTESRGQIMVGFAQSHEYAAREQHSVDAAVTWIAMLGVAPTATSFATWVANLTTGGYSVDTMATTIMAMAAYAARVG